MILRRHVLLLLLASAFAVTAAPLPFDSKADPAAELQAALVRSHESGRPVLLLFGANWCEDCRKLHAALHGERLAPLMAADFETVNVDVGNFDRNMDLAMRFGNPIANGIPAAVVLSPDEQVLYATRAGELADARRMSETGIHDFFRKAAERARLAAPH